MEQRSHMLLLLLWAQLFVTSQMANRGGVILTNLTCESMNTSYLRFDKCSLGVNAQQRRVINVNVHPFNTINSARAYVKLSRQVDRKYQPFLYEDKIDICDFIENPNRHMFWGIFYRTIVEYSNVNHTCPYNHDIIISNLSLEAKELKATPLPRGNYMIQMKTEIEYAIRVKVEVYFARS